MHTRILKLSDENIKFCAKVLKDGGIVAAPTETVYGLFACGTNKDSISKIFEIKNRSKNKPLGLHIGSFEMFYEVVEKDFQVFDFDFLHSLVEEFWPGPLTVILNKTSDRFNNATLNFNSVAVRFPAYKATQKLINSCKFPIVGTSANTSNRPSSITALHVYDDLNGKIEAILDGGFCSFGIESTIVEIADKKVVILRSGAITRKMLEEFVFKLGFNFTVVEKNILENSLDKYLDRFNFIVVDGPFERFLEYVSRTVEEESFFIVFDGEEKYFKDKTRVSTYGTNLAKLFGRLIYIFRELERTNVKDIFFRSFNGEKVIKFLYGKLSKSPNFKLIFL